MTATTMPRALGRIPGCDEQIGERPAEADVATRLAGLIRDEDRKLAATDAARELRRRLCPSGE
jgi:hypothetical protein